MLLVTAAVAATLSLGGASPDPALYPVRLGDPVLHAEETYLSEAASAYAGATDTGTLQCLDLSEAADGHERVCMTAGEWQAVIDRLVAQADNDRSYALFLTDLQFQRAGQRPEEYDFAPPRRASDVAPSPSRRN